MVWIILISLCLLMPSMKAQTAKDALRVVGTWSLELSSKKNGGGEKKKAKYQFLVENDSLVMMIADELGNMEERNSYPLVPKQSGPQGMNFETDSIRIDEDGDTLRSIEELRFRDLDKKTISGSWGMYHWCRIKGWTAHEGNWFERQQSKQYGFTIYFSGRRTK